MVLQRARWTNGRPDGGEFIGHFNTAGSPIKVIVVLPRVLQVFSTPGSFDYFTDSRFSNGLSMHHSVTKSFFICRSLFACVRLAWWLHLRTNTLNASAKWQVMWTSHNFFLFFFFNFLTSCACVILPTQTLLKSN